MLFQYTSNPPQNMTHISITFLASTTLLSGTQLSWLIAPASIFLLFFIWLMFFLFCSLPSIISHVIMVGFVTQQVFIPGKTNLLWAKTKILFRIINMEIKCLKLVIVFMFAVNAISRHYKVLKEGYTSKHHFASIYLFFLSKNMTNSVILGVTLYVIGKTIRTDTF